MRVFVAVDVGDAVRREASRVITALTGKLEASTRPPKVTWVKPEALHVTIRFIGEVDEARIDDLMRRLSPPIAIPAFEVQWRGIGTFPNNRHPRALWLGVIDGAASLAQLEAEVSRRLSGGAFEMDGRALLPHLTLGRVRMAGVGVDWPKLLQSCDVTHAVSRIDRVSLYQSRLSQQGPHYTDLVSAPLGA